eukprot:8193376-Prorocentrum_lima.AAC.1
MVLCLTNGRLETITTTDISTAFLNAPIGENKVVLITAPHILSQIWCSQGRHSLEDSKGRVWAPGKS